MPTIGTFYRNNIIYAKRMFQKQELHDKSMQVKNTILGPISDASITQEQLKLLETRWWNSPENSKGPNLLGRNNLAWRSREYARRATRSTSRFPISSNEEEER